jgi:hypothetical protein
MLPDGKDIPYIIIEKIEYRETEEVSGRKEKGVWVATFAENPYTKLPMILNATNKKRIAKLARNEMINLIKNLPVRLTKEECKDAQDGGLTMGLRISKLPATEPKAATTTTTPKQKQELTIEHPDWNNCVNFLKGDGAMTSLEARFIISDEVKTKLISEVSGASDEGTNAGSGE